MVHFLCACKNVLDHPDDDASIKCDKCGKRYKIVWFADNCAELKEINAKDLVVNAYQVSLPITKYIVGVVLINLIVIGILKLTGVL